MKYDIGADLGGSSSSFVLVDETGDILDGTKDGPCSLMVNGIDSCMKTIRGNMAKLLKKTGNAEDVSAVFGLSGFGDEEKRSRQFLNTCFSAFPGMRIALGNDSDIAIAGSLGGKSGIHIICGTGSSVLGKDLDGERIRAGGWYHLFGGDEGSAYWIGCRLLEEFSRQSDGRDERTMVIPYMMEKYHLNQEHELLNLVIETWQCRRDRLASACLDCAELAGKGDPAALKILEDAAEEQAELIKAVGRRGRFEIPIRVSWSGGVFRSGDLILKPLREKLGSAYELEAPMYSPLAGAVLLAFANDGRIAPQEMLKKIG